MLRSFTLVASCGGGLRGGRLRRGRRSQRHRSQFPVTITTPDRQGHGHEAADSRIVSLSATATESLFAIGAGPQVVAVDDQSDYPKNAPKTTLSGFTPNVEAIASYRPDLVVTSYNPRGLVESLNRLGIVVIFHDAPKKFAGAYQQIRQLGMVTARTAGATRVIRNMKTRIGRVVRAARRTDRTALRVPRAGPDSTSRPRRSRSSARSTRRWVSRNIADEADSAGTGYPQLSAEYIVSASPDLIVLADSVCCEQNASTVSSRPGWERINAVRTGSIVRVHDSIASRWGPRLVSFFRAMSLALARL